MTPLSSSKRSSWPRRAVVASLAVAALAACGSPSASDDSAADRAIGVEAGLDQLEQARVSRLTRDYEVAEASLRRAVEARPADVEAKVALARSLSARHAFADALELADEVLADRPDHPGALALRGDVRLAVGDVVGAAVDHRRLHSVAPGPASLVRLAHGLEESGDPRTALDLVDRAVAELEREESAQGVDPSGETAAWYRWRLADLHRHLGDTATARPLFEEALRIQPGYVLALDGLVDVAITEHRLDDAAALLASWPEGSTIRIEAALAVAEADDDQLAIRGLRAQLIAALESEDRIASGLDLAGALLDASTRADEALELTTDELTRRTNAATLAVHARALHVNGRLDEALTTIEQMLATGTNEPDRIAVAADVFVAAGQVDRLLELPTL